MRLLVSLDPGGTTGYTAGVLRNKTLVVETKQMEWTHKDLWDYLNEMEPATVIIEDFHYRNKSRAGLELISRELLGIARLWDQTHPQAELVVQAPGTVVGKKNYFGNDRLKRMEVYIPGKPHAMDSLRHMLYWLCFGKGYKFYKGQEISLR